MRLTVYRVTIPAWSTIGFGYGTNEAGEQGMFVGDHRPLRSLGEALSRTEEPLAVEMERELSLGGRSQLGG